MTKPKLLESVVRKNSLSNFPRRVFICLALTLLPLATQAQSTTQFLVPSNSVWRLFRGTNEASSPATTWRTNTFDDASWEVGPAPFYYGPNYNPPSGTLLNDMSNNYSCIFLRTTFVLSNTAQYIALTNRPWADDGYITWVNGIEVTRQNTGGAGTFLGYTGTASVVGFFIANRQINSFTNALRVGTNIMAVQVFNLATNDVDFFANPELSAGVADLLPPSVFSVTPASGSQVTNFGQLTITFSEAVTNAKPTDLRINGGTANTASTTNSTNVIYKFSVPAAGNVLVTWDPSAQIKDLSANIFAGTNATYAFSNSLDVPRVVGQSPAAGSTVSSLSQVTVTFNVPITGIEANDLLINGNSASTLTGGGTSWTFSFNQPPPGLVQFNWDGSHAIYDALGSRFDETAPSASWSYTLLDVIAPTVLTTLPSPGATVRSLTQIEVTFRESVSGVNASDLLINGQPATSVVGVGPGPYLFTFAQPANGSVTVSWAGGHGIADASGNAFAGGSWNYSLSPAYVADVVINEIMADNLNGLVDEDGETSDWIELYNRGSNSVSLLGWSLTDDPALPGMWVFPNVTLGAGQYLLVFASGKDRATTTGTNHTSFALGVTDYLGLYNADLPRQVVDEFSPTYPEQRGDISWGTLQSATNHFPGSNFVYFSVATPRAPNSTATNYTGVVEQPKASVASGLFTQPFTLALSCETPGASIYYTTNCDLPSPTNGFLYTGPFTILGTSNKAVMPIRAAAFKTGLLPSTVLTHSYIFPDQVVYQPILPAGFPNMWISDYSSPNGTATADTTGDYEMDPQVLTNNNNAAIVRQALREIPTVSLVTTIDTAFAPTNGVYSGRRLNGNQRPVNAEMILPDGTHMFHVDCGFEIQGGSSPTDANGDWKDKKLSMRLVFKGDFGTPKLHAKVFDDTPVDEFDTLLLDAGLNWWWTHMTDADQRNRAKFITETTVADLLNSSGNLAQHTRYVHVYLDGLYWGLYWLHERMDAAAAASYLGGNKDEWDVLKHTGDANGLLQGTLTNFTAMINLARTLTNNPVGTNTVYEQLQTFLDVPWFIDYMIVNFWCGNDDWPHHNWYAWRRSRTPGSLPWRFVSWDAEHTFKSYNYNEFVSNGNLASASNPGELFRMLTNNLEFRIAFGDHIHKLMFNGGPLYTTPRTVAFWSPTNQSVNNPAIVYRRRVNEIWNSIVCESARWGDVGPSWASAPYTRELHYQRELDALFTITNIAGQTVNYFPLRGSNALSFFTNALLYPTVFAPAFSQHGGRVAPGYNLTISNLHGSGTVYYTTNGNDPRLYGSGAIYAQALPYSSPVPIGKTMTVKSRTLVGTNWSALNEATFVAGSLGVPLRITEIMYNPSGGDAFEFIEMQNVGATTLDLSSYSFSSGINFSFPLSFTIGAGQRIVLGNNANTNAFKGRYPTVQVAGWFGGSLDNGGETLTLVDNLGRTVLSVTYDDNNGWPKAADGDGYSLEINDPNGDPDDPVNWHASAALNGTPGQPNSTPTTSSILLNEVMADNLTAVNNVGTYPDWIELLNTSASPVDLGGWSLTDDGNARKFVFNAGTMIGAGGYLVVWCDATTNVTPGIHTGFSLGRNGDDVYLYDPNTNRMDAISFGPQVSDLSIGRVPSGGASWALTVPTTNSANSAATLAGQTNIVINEWLANSVPGGDDWVELFNTATNAVSLKNTYLGTSNALFQIRSLSFVPPRGYVQLIADENPGPDHLDFKLVATAGTIIFYDSTGAEVQRVNYGAQAQGVSMGRLPDGATNIVSFIGSASPAASNYVINYSGPVLNELLARNSTAVVSPWGNYPDYLELYNPGSNTVALFGFGLSDNAGKVKFTFPLGASIGSNSYLIVWCDGDRPASMSAGSSYNSGFSLSGSSGGAYLFNTIGQLVNYIEYGFQVTDLPIGLSGGQWRLLSAATPGSNNAAPATLGSVNNLRINEWMADAGHGDNDWFELYNLDALPVNMSGLYLTDDPSQPGATNTLIAPLSFIGAKDWVKWIADQDPSQGSDHARFDLDKDGDNIRLYAADGSNIIDTVTFGAQLEGVSQGRLPDGGTNVVSFGGGAQVPTPTPDASNYLPLQDVVINEVLTHTDPPFEDAIEIQNTGSNSVAIGGWWIGNSQRDFKKFRVATGTTLAANTFQVFYENQFNADGSGAGTNFTLNSARGDAVYLSQADGAGNLTGYRAQVEFGAAANAVSFGRFPTSVGVDFVAMEQRTFGADSPTNVAQFRTGTGLPNSYPLIGPIIINEIMYHPVSGTNALENANEEFIELFNTTTNPVPMFDTNNPANVWKLSSGVTFNFNSNITIAAQGYLLLVPFDPITNPTALAAFRARYGTNGTVLGPFAGQLNNAGEALELYRPDAPQQPPHPDAGFVPQILVDRVVYGDLAPWPGAADGGGASLQRINPGLYGNEPLSWKAEPATAGAVNTQSGLTPPFILVQPTNRTVIQNTSGPSQGASFTVVANGAAPLSYQWQHAGTNLIDATNATFSIANVQPTDAGTYRCIITNLAGLIASHDALLTVLVPPGISAQPQDQTVIAGTTAQFSVTANGTAPLKYQWRRNGADLIGQNSASLTFIAQPGDAGNYTVLITNSVGSVTSALAVLVVNVPPTITSDPTNATVLLNSPATFTAAATGTAPLTYQWRKDGINIPGANSASYTILSAQLADEGMYSVMVTNVAGQAFSQAAQLRVNTAPFLTLPQLRGDGAFEFTLNGQTNRQYRVEYTINFGGWTNVTNITLSNPQAPITDHAASNSSARFYRVYITP